MDVLKYFVGFVGAAMILVIIFVRAGERGRMTGGQQAGIIMREGASGLTDIIRAATGDVR